MKKKLCMVLLSLCAVLSVTACQSGGQKEPEETQESPESAEDQEEEEAQEQDSAEEPQEDGEQEPLTSVRLVSVGADEIGDYVTLGEYKGLTVEQYVQDVTEDDVETQINSDLTQNPVEVSDADAEVKDGDIVNIDFEGKKDGVAFDGGTAQGYDLTIGSGSFIEGFEEGLIGCKKGETVDLNLTFPENYQAEELAGQDVVFTVTVNSIKEAAELSEDWVRDNTTYDSVKSYRKGVRKSLKKANRDAARMDAMNSGWSQLMENTEIKERPQKDIDKVLETYQSLMESNAGQMGMTMEEYLDYTGVTQEQVDANAQQYAEELVGQRLVAQAVVDAEGLDLTDEASASAREQTAVSYGYDDFEELLDVYDPEEIWSSVAIYRVSGFILDNANVQTGISTEDGKQGIDMDAEE